ncbi:MAG TPA: hypothetical protein VL020_04940 [Pseudomonadales bacterium]|nr:hypothetical protein [Pseudomonadales bacterium]
MSGCCSDYSCAAHTSGSFAELMSKLGATEVIEGEHSVVATSGKFGGWVQTKDGGLVSIEYAKSLNRAGRRKEGIKL